MQTSEYMLDWKWRFIVFLAIPYALYLALNFLSALIVSECDPSDVECQQGYGQIVLLIDLLLIGFCIFACVWGGNRRSKQRQLIYEKILQHRGLPAENNQSQRHRDQLFEDKVAAKCCGFYGTDEKLYEENGVDDSYETDPDFSILSSKKPDLSTCLFQTWSKVCCGVVCDCWCQCCGMCAIAQEDRELEYMLRKDGKLPEAIQIDYVTFQPFVEYYPAIQELQTSRTNRDFRSHFRALSRLSQILLKCAVVYFALHLVIDIYLGQMFKSVIRVGVLAQATIFLYFVYWQWSRFDISLDSIIKYFASGFIIGSFQAILVETMMMIIIFPIGILLLPHKEDIVTEQTDDGISQGDDIVNNDEQTGAQLSKLISEDIGYFTLVIAIFSFVVAAFVEELVKYYCYWTVETPEQQLGQRSKITEARYITVAMVAAALGFACQENMGYVLQSQDVKTEAFTLILRSLLPVHPLCAAIQSIGIVERDIEGNPTSLLGRCILPAILLHGFFDFAVIEYSLLSFDPTRQQTTPSMSFSTVLPDLVLGFAFVVTGIAWYVVKAREQRQRLGSDVAGAEPESSIPMTTLSPMT